MTTRLERLYAEQGQSPWLDNLQRSYVTTHKLRDLVDRGVRGLTTNPAIFQKALQGSSDYDQQFKALIEDGLSIEQAYWEMILTDINSALDVFAQLHQSSRGEDGYVSVEIDPRLAHDGRRTLEAARLLHERISRPNVMIKIPATLESLPAVRTMISEGRNVNVTLIFSLERYAMVLEQYVSGLEDRLARGLPVDHVASVASFFVSRVDGEVDRQLMDLDTSASSELLGTAAVDQARLAYVIWAEMAESERWKQLAANGARLQRLLWASTSTKNPSYPDTLYVDQLIGPHTVNTLPDATLEAFDDHGTVSRTIDGDLDDVHRRWAQLHNLGIDMASVSNTLEADGVSQFVGSFDGLLAALTEKASTL